MIQSGQLNPSEEIGTGCPVTSKYGRTPPNRHGGVGRQQQQQPYGRGILQSRSHDCFIGSHECLLLLTQPVAVSAFIICNGLCACTEML